jgi:uncharacterized protein YcbK (DUF882 family)
MLATVIHLKFATTLMSGWVSAASPIPMPAAVMAVAFESHVASPIEVPLYDQNRRVSATVVIERDGSTDAETAKQLTYLFRCRTDRQHPIAKKTLSMLASLAERYERPIEFVSAYRVQRGESRTSPHRDARAIDFRIRGVPLREVRDYLWRTYTEVGIGWYPGEQFIHMDSRPTMHDTAWTMMNGRNHYKPYWSELARREAPPVRRRPGV